MAKCPPWHCDMCAFCKLQSRAVLQLPQRVMKGMVVYRPRRVCEFGSGGCGLKVRASVPILNPGKRWLYRSSVVLASGSDKSALWRKEKPRVVNGRVYPNLLREKDSFDRISSHRPSPTPINGITLTSSRGIYSFVSSGYRRRPQCIHRET